MKLSFLLLTVGLLQLSATGYNQEAKLQVKLKDVSVRTVFKEIENQSNYRFVYNNELISLLKNVSVNTKNKNIDAVLVELLEDTEIEYRILDDKLIVLAPKNFIENQDIAIKGKVTDMDGSPLPGVNVIEKGTTNGTVTDINGDYSISVGSSNAILLFSYIGFLTEEMNLDGQTTLDISLVEDIQSLEEVVVIGYGYQKRKDITGSVASVKGDVLNQLPVPSLEQSLTGRAAGVQVIQGSGIPGAGATIRIRGVGTLNNNEPLYVIDGIILGNVAGGSQSDISPLSMINPNDIESIDILKDASATAIYGARAGNGVVIITTKKGSRDKMTITYETYASVNVMDQTKYDQMSGPEWAWYHDATQKANGLDDYNGKAFVDRILAGEQLPTYNWIDEITRNGNIQSHNLSVSGGNEVSSYFSSLSYFNQSGIILGSDLERYTMRFNSEHKIGKRIKFGNNLFISRNNSNRKGNVDPNDNGNNYIERALRTNVYKPIYRADGSYAGSDSFDPDGLSLLDAENKHIIWDAKENKDINTSNRVLAAAYLDIDIFHGLTFHTQASADYDITKSEYYKTYNDIEGTMLVLPEDTRMSLGNTESRTLLIENTLTYNKTFLDNHSITAMVGYQAQNFLRTKFTTTDGAFENTDYWFFNRPHLQTEITDSEGNVVLLLPTFTVTSSNSQIESGVNSYIGRLIYDFKGKYLLTATVRRDGSSKFGPNNRWGTFPAISGAWRISDEDFMPDVSWLSNLKLRAGYGISGSDNVTNYQYYSSVGQGGQFDYSFNGGEIVGATINRLANNYLRWEEIKMTNIAIDAGFLNGRINFVADFYDKTTSDLFLPFAPALELGTETNPYGNLGEVNNKGFDISINTVNVQGKFSWTTDFVCGAVKNEILKLPEDADRFISDGWQNNLINISRVGAEIGAIYGYELDGIFQNWDEVYSHAYQEQKVTGFDDDNNPIYDTDARDDETAQSFTAPGDFRYKDQNGDGIIDADNDRKIIGSTIPDFTWGLTNTFSYKGLMLSVFFQGVHGIDVYNSQKSDYARKSRLDAWDGEGSTNSEPRIGGTGNGRISAYQVENASFMRLKNLRLSYDLPSKIINEIGMQRLQIYGTATNLFTITDYTGYDPEVGLRTGGDNETAGIDNGQYPLTRQYTLGLKVTF